MAETQIAAFRSRWAQAHCALRRIRVVKADDDDEVL